METIFLAATAVIVFVFSAAAVFLWNVTGFLKMGAFDLRFLMLILLAILAKMAFDRVKVVLKSHTD